MTTILITGAAGWLGGVLSNKLLVDPSIKDARLILADIVEPKVPAGADPEKVVTTKADLSKQEAIEALFTTKLGVPDVIYCFHGIMSRGAEDNFDLGFKINVDSIRALLELSRHAKTPAPIKFIFTSSIAVFGGPLPEYVTPATATFPEGSYGCGKLISEYMVNEYSRRGFVDGRIIRLPTITVRPGVPSPATSAAVSGIIREPLKGMEAICPYGPSFDSPELDELAVWTCSPECVISNFIVAANVPAEKFLTHTRVVNLPGFTVTIKEELEALKEVAGEDALKLIKYQHDPINSRIVGSWAARFDNTYALSLGFVVDQGDKPFVQIVRKFKADVEAGLA